MLLKLMLTVTASCFLTPLLLASTDNKQPKAAKLDKLIVTFWSPPPATDDILKEVKSQGYNLTWTPEEGLDAVARQGLKSMLTSDLLTPATLDDPAARAKLDAMLQRVRKHKALAAYYITDEPSTSGMS